jgi:toxin-antitoxin system PIN domain toxin
VSVALLDVNVLLAMLWPQHAFHTSASRWFADHRPEGWATCLITEAGFVRISTQPAVMGTGVSVRGAMQVLESNCADPAHVFWPLEHAVAELLPEIRSRLVGCQQLNDAILLDLAIRRNGRLVTLDRRVASLLPSTSAHREMVEVLEAATA